MINCYQNKINLYQAKIFLITKLTREYIKSNQINLVEVLVMVESWEMDTSVCIMIGDVWQRE